MNAVPGFDGYFATEDGRVVSMRSGAPRELQQRVRDGYWYVTLRIRMHGRVHARPQPVHRLALLAFKGVPPTADLMARHINGDSLDSKAANLAWGTAKDNAADAMRHGTVGPGMKARRRKLNEDQVRQIRRRFQAGEMGAVLAREYGVCESYPSQLSRGVHWAHLSA
ncbi:HNH endonuclease [Janthinobacterium sp. GB4P2]|uniref:HNH endonuclease n=1 Tax=Janthinobacterium sp. GB4P2 TaxID=3424189 RepID=UPI003F27D192